MKVFKNKKDNCIEGESEIHEGAEESLVIWQSDDMKAKRNWDAAQLVRGLLQVKNTLLVAVGGRGDLEKNNYIYSGRQTQSTY